jgi:enamine deaminase RidA (YjgF/YER057c/UK114 family)
MQRQIINPPGTEALYDQLHFATATRVGDRVWISGQCGVDPATRQPGVGMEQQARQAFEGLKKALAAAGASMADIVEVMSFHTDLRGEIADFVKVKDEYLPSRYPCWTAVGVTQLARPEFKVEVRAVAIVGCGAG